MISVTEFLICYFAGISIIAVVLTVADKINAKLDRRRVREDLLLTIGLLGGALLEYITMKIIRHKTRHKKFMIGLPLEIALHIIIAVLILVYA